MRGFIFLAMTGACLSVAQASRAYDFIEAYYDTVVYIENTGYDEALVVVSPGPAITASATDVYGIGVKSEGSTAVYGVGTFTGVQGDGAFGVIANGSSVGTQSTGSGTGYSTMGVAAYAYNGEYSYGVFSNSMYGDYGYGIYASGYGGIESYAGWFDGDVVVTGSCCSSPSDIMFKKNVRSIPKGLSTVMALRPKAYEMKREEFNDRLSLPEGTKFGLIAQEAESVVPELVRQVTAPPRQDALSKDGKQSENTAKKEGLKFKTVDYVGLIPILVQAIQEQQAEIEALKRAR